MIQPKGRSSAAALSSFLDPTSSTHQSHPAIMSNRNHHSSSSSSLTHLRPQVRALQRRLDDFVQNECLPAEIELEEHLRNRCDRAARFAPDAVPPCVERLKQRAKQLGLWNLFLPPRLVPHLPDPSLGPSVLLSYREYGILAETMGRCPSLAPEACNCSAPDTGNMEVLLEFGTLAQKSQYLLPLLKGEIRSCFLMTEPDVASSDPTNLQTLLIRTVHQNDDGRTGYYQLQGRKWWGTGAMDPRCRVALVVARMDDGDTDSAAVNTTSLHRAHTVVAVPLPHPGVVNIRALTAFGYDDAPSGHAEVELRGVQVTEDDFIGGEGGGFRISQARLGPGRIHHCMRAVGMAARCYELMLQRSAERKAFGKLLCEHGMCQELIADAAADLEMARLLTLSCAEALDRVGPKEARDQIALIKATVPTLAHQVVDRAIQIHGAAGVLGDAVLARSLAGLRTLRIADGPDAVHKRTVARLEVQNFLRRAKDRSPQSRL